MSHTPLISRQVFFSNPDHMGVQISPDGRWVSYVAPYEGVLNLWLAPADRPQEATLLTRDQGRGIRTYTWTYLENHLVYQQDKEGDENWTVYALNVETKAAYPLSPETGVHASVQAIGRQVPGEVLLALNERDPAFHDIYRVDLVTGKRILLMENTAWAGFLCDEYLSVRFAFRSLPDGGGAYHQLVGGEVDEAPYLTLSPQDVLTTSMLGFDGSGKKVYMVDSRGRNTSALALLDVATGEREILVEDDLADVDDLLLHPTTKAFWGAAATYDRKRWQIKDKAVEGDLAYLQTLQEGDVEIISMDKDGANWAVVFTQDRAPAYFYLFDRGAKKARFLFSARKSLEGLPLTRMHPRLIKARDGLTLVSYLSLPVELDEAGTGKPSRPVPLILDVHGGPRARDRWGYDPLHQWLTNRGYAVLSVNYRSSTGFGKAFIEAGNGEWAAKMHDDLLDAVDWAVSQGITTKEQVCIMGGSYGGYAALVGLSMTPDVFACGVDIVGPSNLKTLISSIPPYWKPVLDIMKVMMGADPATPEGQAFLAQRSPLTHCENIKKPLLIAQGANDPRVKQAESDQIVHALQRKGIPVTYVLYPDEGHGFLRPENRMSFYATVERFLAQVLGGRWEDVGADFEGSTATFLAGAELIEGVRDQAISRG